MSKSKEPKTFAITATLSIRTTVYVEAVNAEEAMAHFDACHWVNDDRESGELTDWKSHSDPKEES